MHRESANSLYLDLVFDDSSFEKYFEYIDADEFQGKLKNVPKVEGEVKLKSLKIVDKDFLYEIEPGLHAYETYLLSEYGPDITFPYVPSGLLIVYYSFSTKGQVSCISSESGKRELSKNCGV